MPATLARFFRQNEGGDLAKLNYYFFAQIFLAPGTPGGGTLIDPRRHATQRCRFEVGDKVQITVNIKQKKAA